MTDDVRRLLAGYATGTLSDEEKRVLLETALVDEELFAAIADEEPLRELLSAPAARTELLSRIEPAPRPLRERFAAWLRRPTVAAGMATAAVGIVVISIVPLMRLQPVAAPTVVRHKTAVLQAPAMEPEAARPVPPAGPPPAAPERKTKLAAVPPVRSEAAPAVAGASEPTAEVAVVSPPAAAAAPPEAAEQRADAAAPKQILEPVTALPVPITQPAASPILTFREQEATGRLTRAQLADEAKRSQSITVLRKVEAGYEAVNPAEAVFAPGDLVRIRVVSAESSVVSIRGAIADAIVGALAPGRPFETGDIRIGNTDMNLSVSFGRGSGVIQTLARRQASEASRLTTKNETPVAILLRVKKP